ncbi:MAG: hypothetical protein IPM21_03060 [Acidobacteria bacterium]|nr:hypothetical protein [Acidobacteriota bacterium]
MGEGIAKGFQDSADPFNKEVAGFQREEEAFNAVIARYRREMNRLRALQAGTPANAAATPPGAKPARPPKDDSARRAAEAERERIRIARQLYEDQTAYFAAEARKRFAIVQEYAEAEKRSAADVARFQEFPASTRSNSKAKLGEYIKKLVPGTNEHTEHCRNRRSLSLTSKRFARKREKRGRSEKKAATEGERKLHTERKQRWKERHRLLEQAVGPRRCRDGTEGSRTSGDRPPKC